LSNDYTGISKMQGKNVIPGINALHIFSRSAVKKKEGFILGIPNGKIEINASTK
jgi:hypothetical protein